MGIKKAAKLGLLVSLMYFTALIVQITFNNDIALCFFSIITMLSGLYMVLLVASFPVKNEAVKLYRTMANICASACMVLTSAAHFMNIAVIMPLIETGTPVPEYMQIGQYPSVLMGIDYLGWGLFMGLAFVFSARFIEASAKLKKIIMVCGCLCLFGFAGVLFNENLWYVAPLGYGVGTVIICVNLLRV